MVEERKFWAEIDFHGAINDDEFSAVGEASGDPETGEYQVRLEYRQIPRNWHPLMYTDVKTSLLFLREEETGQNLLSLTGGAYATSGTVDLGDGHILRNNTTIRPMGDNRFQAAYIMFGAAETGDLASFDFFEETMLPFGPGRIAALGLARWTTTGGEHLDALFSTRYRFDTKHRLAHAQVRRVEAEPEFQGSTFTARYRGVIQPAPTLPGVNSPLNWPSD